MKTIDNLPALPAEMPVTRQKGKPDIRLATESFWVSQIRRLFKLNMKPQGFVPCMPVPKKGILVRVARWFGNLKGE